MDRARSTVTSLLAFFLLVSALLWPLVLAAENEPVQSPLPPRFTRLDIQHGLSQATVTALAQDLSGNIWIGTQNGLNRFDGFSVKIYQPTDAQTDPISDNFVSALQVDSSGQLWIGTLKGLNRYDPTQARFSKVSTLSAAEGGNEAILALHFDAQQRLWVGTERGLALYQRETDSLQPWPATTTAPYQQLNISAITSDADGNLWLGTPRGLFHVDSRSGELLQTAPLEKSAVLSLLYDNAQRLWVGQEHDGLHLLDGSGWHRIELTGYHPDVISREVRTLHLDHQQRLWVGTQHGLHQVQQRGEHWQQTAAYFHQRYNSNSLGGGKVVSLLQDSDNSLWIGTWNSGVSRLNSASNLFTSITPDAALMAQVRNPATIALIADTNKLWAGTADGLFRLDVSAARFQAIGDPQESETFYCALRLGDSLLFGHSGGVKRLQLTSGDYQNQPLPADLPAGPVRRMQQSAHFLWLAIEQYGLVLLDKQFQQVVKFTPLSRSVTFIKPFNEQLMLVGSYDGLFWFDSQTGDLLYTHALGAAADNAANSLPYAPMDYVQTADGRHWLATNGAGLYQLEIDTKRPAPAHTRFISVTDSSAIVSQQLKSLAPDHNGNIWLSTSDGVAVYETATGHFRSFGPHHGTLSRDYINAAVATLPNGDIVFGGMDGFTLFNPAQVLAYTPPVIAIPQIQRIDVNGMPLQQDDLKADAALASILHTGEGLTLPAAGSRSVSLSFSTREFIESPQVQFQYRLDPLSEDWISKDATDRSASFERLPPGNYQFRLRAGLPQSGWSPELQLSIAVPPQWWETWLARLALFLLLVISLVAIHITRLHRLQRQQQQLAQLVDERTRALADAKERAEQALQQLASTMKELVRTEKMAALGQLVAGVAHEVNTPLGVALTASSIVNEESHKLHIRLAEGAIRKQELESYLNKLTQASQLLNTNLQRAAHLVMNFKQVSVDRTSDNQRRFNLAEYLHELLESLRLMWRSRQIDIDIDCPDNIVLDSFPGTLGQIITNFCQNALIHAFKDRPSGKISIRCKIKDSQLEIRFADDGNGISKDNLERIFDPFFTTNRQQGGTGLGLHIVYNLITQKLGGSVSVSSEVGKGTEFMLYLPLKV